MCGRPGIRGSSRERSKVKGKDLHGSRFQFGGRKGGDLAVKRKTCSSHSAGPKPNLVAKPVSLLYILAHSLTQLLKLGTMATIQLTNRKSNHQDLLPLSKLSFSLLTTTGTATTLIKDVTFACTTASSFQLVSPQLLVLPFNELTSH